MRKNIVILLYVQLTVFAGDKLEYITNLLRMFSYKEQKILKE